MLGVLKWIGIIFGGLVIVVIFALIALGIMLESGFVPSERVQTGTELSERTMTVLRDNEIIDPDEIVELFYSEGLLSAKEGGSIVTDRRVIAYSEVDGELEIYEMAYGDIESIEQTVEGSYLEFATFVVSSSDADYWLELWLPHEHGDAERFIDAIEAKLKD